MLVSDVASRTPLVTTGQRAEWNHGLNRDALITLRQASIDNRLQQPIRAAPRTSYTLLARAKIVKRRRLCPHSICGLYRGHSSRTNCFFGKLYVSLGTWDGINNV